LLYLGTIWMHLSVSLNVSDAGAKDTKHNSQGLLRTVSLFCGCKVSPVSLHGDGDFIAANVVVVADRDRGGKTGSFLTPFVLYCTEANCTVPRPL